MFLNRSTVTVKNAGYSLDNRVHFLDVYDLVQHYIRVPYAVANNREYFLVPVPESKVLFCIVWVWYATNSLLIAWFTVDFGGYPNSPSCVSSEPAAAGKSDCLWTACILAWAIMAPLSLGFASTCVLFAGCGIVCQYVFALAAVCGTGHGRSIFPFRLDVIV